MHTLFRNLLIVLCGLCGTALAGDSPTGMPPETSGRAGPPRAEPSRPQGRPTTIGVGAGMVVRSSPYRDADSGLVRGFPAVTYVGKRLQVLGPIARLELADGGRARLAATARYRFGAYEEDDSPVLNGLGDRDDTLMAGVGVVADLSDALSLAVRYDHDVLDRIGGGEAELMLSKPFQWRASRITPRLGLNWMSEELAHHDFGTPDYEPGHAVSFEAGVGSMIGFKRNWQLTLGFGVEVLPDEVTDSPIVDEDVLVKGFASISYIL